LSARVSPPLHTLLYVCQTGIGCNALSALTTERRLTISRARKGHTHSAETKATISVSHLGINHTAETQSKLSAALGTPIFAYSSANQELKLDSVRQAALNFKYGEDMILRYINTGILFQEI
jgi:hypothetical protein